MNLGLLGFYLFSHSPHGYWALLIRFQLLTNARNPFSFGPDLDIENSQLEFLTKVDIFKKVVREELPREGHHEVSVAVLDFGVDQVPGFVRLQLALPAGKKSADYRFCN